jgi:predicted ATPase
MTLEAKKENDLSPQTTNPIAFVKDSNSFNTQLLHGRLDQYTKALQLNKEVLFYDRGMPDVIAYMDYFEQSYADNFTVTCKQHKYNQIFILPPWEAIYVQDNERFESYAQAQDIHHHLEKTYTSFGYEIVMVPFGTVADRMDFILNNIQK